MNLTKKQEKNLKNYYKYLEVEKEKRKEDLKNYFNQCLEEKKRFFKNNKLDFCNFKEWLKKDGLKFMQKRYFDKLELSDQVSYIFSKIEEYCNLDAKKVIEKTNNILNCDVEIKKINLIVLNFSWVKSNTWGSNPKINGYYNLNGQTRQIVGTYTVGGCGYDKLSAAASNCLNSCNWFAKMVVLAVLNYKGCYPFSKESWGIQTSFSGCGMSTLANLLENLGFTTYWDNYTFIAKRQKGVKHE